MAIVGNAHIIVQAITTGFKKDVEKALKDLNSSMTESGEKSSKNFNKGFDREFKDYIKDFDPFEGKDKLFQDGGKNAGKSFSSEFKTNLSMMKTLDLMGGDFEKAGKKAGKRFANGFNGQFKRSLKKQVPQALMPIGRGRVASNAFKKSLSSIQQDAIRANEALARLITVGYFVGPAISIAVSGLSSLIGGLFPLISQINTVLPALMVIPSSIAAIGQAALVGKIALGGFGDAIKAITERRQGSEKKDPLAGMSESALSFATAIVNAKDKVEVLRKAAGKNLFEPLESSLDRIVSKLFPRLIPSFERTGAAIGNMADQFSKAVANASNLNELERVMSTNADVLTIFGSTLANVYDSLLSLGDAARPLLVRFAKWTSTLTAGWKRSLELKNSTGKLTETFKKSGDMAGQLGRIFGNLGRAIMTMGRAASGPGSGGKLLVDLFEKSTKRFEEFTSSLSKSGRLKEFFYDLAVNFNELSVLIVIIVKEFLKLGDDKGIGDTAKVLGSAVEILGEMLTVLNEAGPALGEFVKKFVEFLMHLTESESIKIFFSVLNTALDTLNNVFGSNTVKTIFTFLAAIKAAMLAIRLLKNIAVFFTKALIMGYFAKAAKATTTFNLALAKTKSVALANRAVLGQLGAAASIAGASFKQAGSNIVTSFTGISTQSKLAGTAVNAGFVASFKNLKSNLGVAVKGIKDGFKSYKAQLAEAGSSVGQVVGQAMGMAISAALSGVILGTSGGDRVQQGIGIAGILMSAIGTGAMVGGGVGAAVGVAVGAIGLVTAAFAASGERAKKAAADIKEYSDALYEAAMTGESAATALEKIITGKFREESDDVADLLKNMGFYAEDLADAIDLGAASFETYALSLISSGLKEFGIDIKEYGIESLDDLEAAIHKTVGRNGEFKNAVMDSGVSVEDLRDSIGFLSDQAEDGFAGASRAAIDAAIANKDLAAAGKLVGDKFFESAADADLFASKLKDINDEAGRQNKLERVISRISDELNTLKDKADIAKNAVLKLLNPPTTFQEVISQATLDLAGFGKDLADIEGPFSTEKLVVLKADIRKSLSSSIQEGFESGAFKGAEDVQKLLSGLSAKVDLMGLSEADAKTLKKEITDLTNSPDILELFKQWGVAQGQAIGKERALSEIDSYQLAMDRHFSKNAGLTNKLLSGEALTKQEEIDLRRSPTKTQTVFAELRIETSLIKAETAAAIAELEKEFEGKFEILPTYKEGSLQALIDAMKNKIETIKDIKVEVTPKTPSGPSTAWGAPIKTDIERGVGDPKVYITPDLKPASSWKVPGTNTPIRTQLKVDGTAMGRAFDQGLAEGLNAKVSESVIAAQRLANRIIAMMKLATQMKSPSRVFKNIGKSLSEGLALGISEGAGLALSAAKDLASGVANASQFSLGSPSQNMSFAGMSRLSGGAGAFSNTTNQKNTTQNFNIQVESPRPMRTAKDVVREFQAASYRMGY